MPDASFPVEVDSGIPVVVTPAEVDITNAAGLRGVLLGTVAARPATLVVDMSRTTFCDTAGIHALVSAHKQARADNGEVRLVIASPTVRRILAITGLDKVIPSYRSRAEALTAPFSGRADEDSRPKAADGG